jgi:alkanesulfonate monooxygenase SsuD/methylene tetrahydromethanopterin reductase-like flavin-dependent oxidoreductase (luciferase family)
MQAGSSNRGRDFAARWAEIIFEIDPTADSRQPTANSRKAYYADIKHRAAVFDRDTDSVKISEVIHGAAFFNWANRLILSLGESVASSK